MLLAVVGQWEGVWRVVGITQEAMDVFAEHNFLKVTRMGINRSHLIARKDSFNEMIQREMPRDEWWTYFKRNDQTVFATSSQNQSKAELVFTKFHNADGLFKSKGFAWAHGVAESDFLRKLHADNSKQFTSETTDS